MVRSCKAVLLLLFLSLLSLFFTCIWIQTGQDGNDKWITTKVTILWHWRKRYRKSYTSEWITTKVTNPCFRKQEIVHQWMDHYESNSSVLQKTLQETVQQWMDHCKSNNSLLQKETLPEIVQHWMDHCKSNSSLLQKTLQETVQQWMNHCKSNNSLALEKTGDRRTMNGSLQK